MRTGPQKLIPHWSTVCKYLSMFFPTRTPPSWLTSGLKSLLTFKSATIHLQEFKVESDVFVDEVQLHEVPKSTSQLSTSFEVPWLLLLLLRSLSSTSGAGPHASPQMKLVEDHLERPFPQDVESRSSFQEVSVLYQKAFCGNA